MTVVTRGGAVRGVAAQWAARPSRLEYVLPFRPESPVELSALTAMSTEITKMQLFVDYPDSSSIWLEMHRKTLANGLVVLTGM